MTELSGPIRALLARFQDYGEAHLTLEAALSGLRRDLRGVRPPGLPHSIWELVEHIRRAQRDILEFCQEGPYTERTWPKEYWPADAAPSDEATWATSLASLREDREALRRIALDELVDLEAIVPHGEKPTQTYVRALLLAQDHAAYHIGQIVTVRQLLGE